jgi:hypothetical protein
MRRHGQILASACVLFVAAVACGETAGGGDGGGARAEGVWEQQELGPPPDDAVVSTASAPTPGPVLPSVDDEGTLVLGVTYRYPLFIHCGMDYLGSFNGSHWYRDQRRGGPAPETGAGRAPPAHWPVAREKIFGFVELVALDRIDYSIGPTEVIATYLPSDRPPPGCD